MHNYLKPYMMGTTMEPEAAAAGPVGFHFRRTEMCGCCGGDWTWVEEEQQRKEQQEESREEEQTARKPEEAEPVPAARRG